MSGEKAAQSPTRNPQGKEQASVACGLSALAQDRSRSNARREVSEARTHRILPVASAQWKGGRCGWCTEKTIAVPENEPVGTLVVWMGCRRSFRFARSAERLLGYRIVSRITGCRRGGWCRLG